MLRKIGLILLALVVLALGVVYAVGLGFFGDQWSAGEPSARAVSQGIIDFKEDTVRESALDIGVARPKQILFGDLHVHSTFSFDAFTLSLPMSGGDGAHPVSDACDFARHCSALDFWSINDHAITLTPRRWNETVEAIRQCNDIAGSETNPDLVTYLGWEWTQVGATPATHYGHKNVIIRGLDEVEIPTRPIAAGAPLGIENINDELPSPLLMGAYGLYDRERGGLTFSTYQAELMAVEDCPIGVPVRELPDDCRESASTPGELFAKLDDWGFDSLVIPHGTTWGFYTPMGSSWDKQLTLENHDPDRQKLIEVFSGHGNSEEYRPFEEIAFDAAGAPTCPVPANDYLPSCWRAGEIIAERCRAEGESEDECVDRAARARQLYVEAPNNGGANVVPASQVADWQDSGQCRDCFQPSFNYRPKSSTQYIMALGRDDGQGGPFRFDFGFIAASDNHSARPGTGYKEVARSEFTEARFGNMRNTPVGVVFDPPEWGAEAIPFEFDPSVAGPLAAFEVERGASFFLNGGLAAVHAEGRDRDSIWEGMDRKEVYGTSGPRILLWFDLLNSPGRGSAPMGSQVELAENPIFQVKAVGSFAQNPGCGPDSIHALGADRIRRLCQVECYNPSTLRRPISRIEVVRIRPQRAPTEEIVGLVEDPWKVIECDGDPQGCVGTFVDEEYLEMGRDVLYYARAIEAPSEAVGADPLGCRRDEEGRCAQVDPCFGRPNDDECLAQTEERAWSSPIFINQTRRSLAAR
ncbi:MAG: DUF3604 domain-containing protein [bacterium]|nr:hypothetical protein [Deltaproteobacteria bacterium]MCP4905227.1 DUF3604 domain-containing protein [bacterium]